MYVFTRVCVWFFYFSRWYFFSSSVFGFFSGLGTGVSVGGEFILVFLVYACWEYIRDEVLLVIRFCESGVWG